LFGGSPFFEPGRARVRGRKGFMVTVVEGQPAFRGREYSCGGGVEG
jgi:hypothetical protein